MQLRFYATLFVLLILQTGKAHAQAATNMPDDGLMFTENEGQVADAAGAPRPDVLFTAHSGGAAVFLTANGLSYQFREVSYPAGYERNEKLVTDHKNRRCCVAISA